MNGVMDYVCQALRLGPPGPSSATGHRRAEWLNFSLSNPVDSPAYLDTCSEMVPRLPGTFPGTGTGIFADFHYLNRHFYCIVHVR